MNSKIPTDQYKQIQFRSPNVLGIYLKTNKHNLIIINIYSDCNNNDTINVVREFLLTRFLDEHIPDDTQSSYVETSTATTSAPLVGI